MWALIASLASSVEAADSKPVLPTQAVYRVPTATGTDDWVTGETRPRDQLRPPHAIAQFQAIVSKRCPPGMVPIYAVEWEGRVELRRRPRPGRENTTEPLFFALPPEEEAPAAGRITGFWNCEATHRGGNQSYFAWELAIEGTNIVGRFDQESEYRFAYIPGGTLIGNTFTLNVDYNDSKYHMIGTQQPDALVGTWRQLNESNQGTWKASREQTLPPPPSADRAVPLYEWQRSTDGAKRYAIPSTQLEPGWVRAPRPLGRVWPMP